MEMYKWIQACGNCTENELKDVICRNLKDFEIFIALYTDKFECQNVKELKMEQLSVSTLLEIRIFNEHAEFYAVRGTIGNSFSWRLTNDENLDELDFVERLHYIDQNEAMKVQDQNQEGDRSLITTVGGIYHLPITSEKRIRVKSYVAYDENGVAKVVDNRICGFID